ncbi:hypothetical protein GGTG_09290 [Gaeumannomyces tritici R3-111a-1]|uniref:Uncharacterized protein n=1 Tax=Gaeumannomyces tritici (strain R3-111a-1) TaxID=644352 RepID=J3P6Z3_GAET3|nr:hypothetical protein GGTG_09290 [Gaeumannomyces tritici R3-111a-1]EJT72424.1 hypothetical protein GGTG_09290 [Gaeumannomyces tritici R3-111a-1]
MSSGQGAIEHMYRLGVVPRSPSPAAGTGGPPLLRSRPRREGPTPPPETSSSGMKRSYAMQEISMLEALDEFVGPEDLDARHDARGDDGNDDEAPLLVSADKTSPASTSTPSTPQPSKPGDGMITSPGEGRLVNAKSHSMGCRDLGERALPLPLDPVIKDSRGMPSLKVPLRDKWVAWQAAKPARWKDIILGRNGLAKD